MVSYHVSGRPGVLPHLLWSRWIDQDTRKNLKNGGLRPCSCLCRPKTWSVGECSSMTRCSSKQQRQTDFSFCCIEKKEPKKSSNLTYLHSLLIDRMMNSLAPGLDHGVGCLGRQFSPHCALDNPMWRSVHDQLRPNWSGLFNHPLTTKCSTLIITRSTKARVKVLALALLWLCLRWPLTVSAFHSRSLGIWSLGQIVFLGVRSEWMWGTKSKTYDVCACAVKQWRSKG